MSVRKDEVLYRVENNIAYITLNRPEKKNALNLSTCQKLLEAFEKCRNDKNVRVVLLTGTGDTFCSGGDIQEMKRALNNEDIHSYIHRLNTLFNKTVLLIRNLSKPVIAAIHGTCSGGGAGIAFACDILIASSRAKIHIPNIQIGLVPDGGTSYFLAQKLGFHRAAEIFFLSGSITAEEASIAGIFNHVAPPKHILPMAETLAQKIAQAPAYALGIGKHILHKAFENNLETQLSIEQEAVLTCVEKKDFKEGITAFLEKRKPVFKD